MPLTKTEEQLAQLLSDGAVHRTQLAHFCDRLDSVAEDLKTLNKHVVEGNGHPSIITRLATGSLQIKSLEEGQKRQGEDIADIKKKPCGEISATHVWGAIGTAIAAFLMGILHFFIKAQAKE